MSRFCLTRQRPLCLARLFPLLAALCVLAACTTAPRQVEPPAPVAVSALPGFAADPLDGLAVAITQQCARAQPPAGWRELCASRPGDAAGADRAALAAWIDSRFVARELVDAENPAGLVTGYYEPLLTGSLVKDRPGQVPLRGRPPDLLTIDLAAVEPRLKGLRLRGRLEGTKVVPYYSREEMARAEAATAPAAPVLAWADDPVDAFFLEIQGSGRLRLRDGSMMRVGYADQNGHPYRAIG